MAIKQVSVFLENSSGRLGEVTKTLAKAGINIRAISIADTADFGILRLIVDNDGAAFRVLTENGFTTRTTDVAAVEIDDTPGSLAKILDFFQGAGINIEYLYASLESKVNKAVIIFKMDDHETGLSIIREHGLCMIDSF
ncbi:MAG: ACT domain-containing protein [Spirochaetaceae bacterium]|jgi:hypothetical protein|nr:ACT domain-containing protein [Spirochaetaceae bacterium]